MGPIGNHQRSFQRHHALRPPLSQDWGSHPTQNSNRYYLRNGKSYGFQIWPVYSEGPSEQKSIKIFEKSERGRIQGLSIFRVPLIILQAHL